MKILMVAATQMEVKMLVDVFEPVAEKSHILKTYKLDANTIDVLVAGIGPTFTAFHLTNALRDKKYDLVINIGIAGSFTPELSIGEVVSVVSDEFADLGIEDGDDFKSLFDTGFMDVNEFPFENGVLRAPDLLRWPHLKKVRGITVNTSHGSKYSIEKLKQRFPSHVESMEGAAVFYVCKWMGVEFAQIRSISNHVEVRDVSKWNIPQALENLNHALLEILQHITTPVN